MGFVFTITLGLILWIVLWALDVKGFDAFMLTTVIVLLAALARMLKPFLPGNNE
jgi:hypothetical protein